MKKDKSEFEQNSQYATEVAVMHSIKVNKFEFSSAKQFTSRTQFGLV